MSLTEVKENPAAICFIFRTEYYKIQILFFVHSCILAHINALKNPKRKMGYAHIRLHLQNIHILHHNFTEGAGGKPQTITWILTARSSDQTEMWWGVWRKCRLFKNYISPFSVRYIWSMGFHCNGLWPAFCFVLF